MRSSPGYSLRMVVARRYFSISSRASWGERGCVTRRGFVMTAKNSKRICGTHGHGDLALHAPITDLF